VRSQKHKPKGEEVAALMRWHQTGWVEYTMKLKEDTELRQLRQVSTEQRVQFANGLKVGDVVGTYCGGEAGEEVSHTFFFWSAKVRAKSKADARLGDSPVLMKADAADPGWGIDRGEYILNIQWLRRLSARVWELAGEQTVPLVSVLPLRVVWDKETTNTFTLSQPQHHELTRLCKCVRVLDPSQKRQAK
jgi:hypothetical protein